MDDPQASPPFRTYEEVWAEAFTGAFEAMSVQGDAAAAARRCIQDLGVRQPLEEDTTATLKHLATDWPLAVLSNADDNFLLPVIAHNGWSFNTVVSSESARVYKPDPRIFAAFCEEASVLPEQVLYVGDSPYDDIHGAKLAGMHAVLIRSANPTPGRTPPPDGQELLKADFEIGSLREMEPLLTEHVTPAQSRR
jgi:2-haloalkanoic acid dehalogenase type II